MYKSAVKYYSTWLAPASRALELYHAKKFKELDAHLKDLDKKERNLLEQK
jgi:hypothetical protein